jgi:hypothetical protein
VGQDRRPRRSSRWWVVRWWNQGRSDGEIRLEWRGLGQDCLDKPGREKQRKREDDEERE